MNLINFTEAIKIIEAEERHWLNDKIGLIPDFEGTTFGDQKYASNAWKLIRAIVKSPEKSVSLDECKIITGNPKWIEMMDHDNIIMIDDQNRVKADSKILLNIFEEVVNKKGFDDILKKVCERVEVDSEQRTRELIWRRKKSRRSWFWWW